MVTLLTAVTWTAFVVLGVCSLVVFAAVLRDTLRGRR
jgi:hypothetical protein